MKRFLVLAIAALPLAGCTAKAATSRGVPPPTSIPSTTTMTSPGVGSTQSFSAEDVTVTNVIDPAAVGSFGPPAGDRFVAVELEVKNTGTTSLSPTPIFDATLVDQAGQSYTPVVNGTPSCQDFSGSLSVDPGTSASGCVLFEVPTSGAPAKFQYVSKEAGANVQRAEWSL